MKSLSRTLRNLQSAVLDGNHSNVVAATTEIEGAMREMKEVVILFLERSAFDDAACVCEPGDPGLECMAMRVLGWGKHWDKKKFERRARREK